MFARLYVWRSAPGCPHVFRNQRRRHADGREFIPAACGTGDMRLVFEEVQITTAWHLDLYRRIARRLEYRSGSFRTRGNVTTSVRIGRSPLSSVAEVDFAIGDSAVADSRLPE